MGGGGGASAGSTRWKLAGGGGRRKKEEIEEILRRKVEFSESERCVGEEEEVFGETSTKGKAVVTKR